MYQATIFGSEETASAIRSSSRDERTNADQTAPGVNNRAGAGEEIVKREPRQISFIQVFSDLCSDNKVSN